MGVGYETDIIMDFGYVNAMQLANVLLLFRSFTYCLLGLIIDLNHERQNLFGSRTTKIVTSNDWLTKYLMMQNVDGVPIG